MKTFSLPFPLPWRPGPADEAGTRAELAARIEKLRKACGCAESLIGLLAGLGLFYAGAGRQIIVAVLLALAGAITGKILGLAWARQRRLALESYVATRFPAQPLP